MYVNISHKLQADLKPIFERYFPKSRIEVFQSAMRPTSYYFCFTLGENKLEYINGIEHNDPLRTVGWIHLKPNNMYEFECKPVIGRIKPSKSSLAMECQKIRTRKSTVDYDTMVSKFEKLIERVYQSVSELAHDDKFLELPYCVKSKLAEPQDNSCNPA